MRNWNIRFRAIDRERFEEVRSGRKSVETRAATIKYQPIIEGDTMTFVCGKEHFTLSVKKKNHFQSPKALFKTIPLKKVMPDLKSVTDAEKRYASYPGYAEKIKEFGLFAFELK
jgi:ASC-1-like (ASCH) protein